MRTMTAKFDGRCRHCGTPFEAGEKMRWSKATGSLCASQDDCNNMQDARAEQAAEMRMESWAEHRMAGTTEHFWANQEYEREMRAS